MSSKIIIVSNRLPVVLKRSGKQWTATPASGGLVTAMSPVMDRQGGKWIGWPGVGHSKGVAEAIQSASNDLGYKLIPTELSQSQVDGFYYGFANEILWPLLHGFETRCNFDPGHWQNYREANALFARTAVQNSGSRDFLWIHDYHLMLVANQIRKAGQRRKCGFFLHIPFPPPDVFFKLPWRKEILEGLLAFDLVGFQTLRDRRNFIQCLRQMGLEELTVRGRRAVVDITLGSQKLRAGAFPISIDYQGIAARAASEDIASMSWLFHEKFPSRQIMIGMDRLDYTKGIPERLEAFRYALQKYPEMMEKITLVQVTVPSREKVHEYENLRAQIEQLVGEINGELTSIGDWVPIHYIHRSFGRDDVLCMLRAAEIAIITPLRDGMNLVAKEYCASDVNEHGVVILSEFAGVAAEFKRRALLVNPYDREGMADAIFRAFHMGPGERKRRMHKLRRIVRKNDIFNWTGSFLAAAGEVEQSRVQEVEDFTPDFRINYKR